MKSSSRWSNHHRCFCSVVLAELNHYRSCTHKRYDLCYPYIFA